MKAPINKKEVKNILVTRTDRLGDVILTLPLISEVKRIFKISRVLFLVKQYAAELITDYEGIDELITEENLGGFYNKYKFFKAKRIDLVISVKPEFELALIFFLLGIKYRIGTGYRWYSFLYNCKVYEHRKTSDKHESDYNLNLLKNFVKEVSPEKKFYFKYSEHEKNVLNEKISRYKLNFDDDYIIIHPGSGSSAKDLPIEKFTGFIGDFLKKFDGYKIVFTGLESERHIIEKILSGMENPLTPNIVNLMGALNLKELMILIDNSKLFMSNSTGPIHIAGALNKNIIGFYPNESVMSDIRWKPLGRNVTILKPDKTDNMNTIEIQDMIDATSRILVSNKGTQ